MARAKSWRPRTSGADPLRERLRKRGIELIAPYRSNNRNDGTKMAARCAAISGAGSWSEPTPVSGSSAACWFVMSHLLSTYYAFFYLACFWFTLRRYF